MSNRLRFRFRDTAGGGSTSPAPVNTVAPAITGNAYVGSTLTCSTGTWTFSPLSYAYQWKADAGNVGTNQNTYVPVTGDIGKVITCVVTATNITGSTPATSNATAAVIAVPANTVAPAVTGTTTEGQTLTSTTGTWTGGGSITYSYQWKRTSTNVGTNQNTYVLVGADVGSNMTCVVTASNAAGTGSGATSNSVGPVVSAAVGFNPSDKNSNVTLSNSNYTAAMNAGGAYGAVRSVTAHQTGLWYAEYTLTNLVLVEECGFANSTQVLSGSMGGTNAAACYQDGNYYPGPVAISAALATNDVVCIAMNKTTDKVWFRKNGGNWNNAVIGSQDPANGVGGITMPAGCQGAVNVYLAWAGHSLADSITLNTGGSAFAQTPPSGFTAWG